MNRIWDEGEEQGQILYNCNVCGRTVYVAKNGQYLPIHRKKGARPKCVGSGTHINRHKKV
jgi:hypothetical protein